MHNDPTELISIISEAVGRKLDVGKGVDLQTIQKGCYLLNSWGVEPRYRYPMYAKGPYSSELMDDCLEHGNFDTDSQTASPELVSRLNSIFSKGLKYAEAYTTVMSVQYYNPDVDNDRILDKTLRIRPDLKEEVLEASVLLLN